MLQVIFEDEFILALNKPSGTPSHTLENSVQLSCEALLSLERPQSLHFLLHRLDTGTSGVLLFGKSEIVYQEMREKFQQKELKKTYLAWTARSEEKLKVLHALSFPCLIDVPLAHHPKSKKRMMVLPQGKHRHYRGKPIPAISILHSFRESEFAGVSAIEIELEIVTGVMHQIRVHLESLGLPLLGDPLYGEESAGGTRLALHARKIEFELLGKTYVIEASQLQSPPIN